MVLAPAAVLSAIFALSAATWASLAGTAAAPAALAAGAACFAAAVIMLVRTGLREVARLERTGLTDALTGLPNRAALHQDFKQLGRSEEEVALALIDLDGFMLVNEHYGHSMGDRVIREAGAIFLTICGDEAVVYRLGGDEFALLKSGPLAATLLEGMCRRIVERLMRPMKVDERRLALGVSNGVQKGHPIGVEEGPPFRII